MRANLSEPEPKLRERLQAIYDNWASEFVKENVAPFIAMTPETFWGVYAMRSRSPLAELSGPCGARDEFLLAAPPGTLGSLPRSDRWPCSLRLGKTHRPHRPAQYKASAAHTGR